MNTTANAIGPMQAALVEIRELLAEVSEVKVRAKVFFKQTDEVLHQDASVEKAIKITRFSDIGVSIQQQVRLLKRRMDEWVDKTLQLLREYEHLHLTAEELMASHELVGYLEELTKAA